MAGLYLHIPFCTQRCTYCDFYFVTTQKSPAAFLKALRGEIRHYGDEFGGREPIESIYFGGGTPSLLHPDEIAQLLGVIDEVFDTSGVVETTLELNPDDAGVDRLRGYRQAGVDRLSIGIQSFYADDLAFMNRSHSELQAREVVDAARSADFENITIDLIFGLPEQPFEYWAANLERAIGLGVPHLSTYSLTVEPRTVLNKQVERGLVTPLPEDEMAERYRFTMQYLREAGYAHYEISSFAQPGAEAVHNSRYWEHGNYLGFGPSAHSFWWSGLPARRWANVRNLRAYESLLSERQIPLESRERLTLDDLANEYLLLGLRTSAGVDLNRLDERYGVDLLEEKVDQLAWLEGDGFIEPIRSGRVCLTDEGKILCDSITQQLLLSE